jgi:hypothetical protein
MVGEAVLSSLSSPSSDGSLAAVLIVGLLPRLISVGWAEIMPQLGTVGESVGDGALGHRSLCWGCHWSCSTYCKTNLWVKTVSNHKQASAAPLASCSSLEVSLLEIGHILWCLCVVIVVEMR